MSFTLLWRRMYSSNRFRGSTRQRLLIQSFGAHTSSWRTTRTSQVHTVLLRMRDRGTHKSVENGFISARTPGGFVKWDRHGAACRLCLDVVESARELHGAGHPVRTIRRLVVERFYKTRITPTPTLPDGHARMHRSHTDGAPVNCRTDKPVAEVHANGVSSGAVCPLRARRVL